LTHGHQRPAQRLGRQRHRFSHPG